MKQLPAIILALFLSPTFGISQTYSQTQQAQTQFNYLRNFSKIFLSFSLLIGLEI